MIIGVFVVISVTGDSMGRVLAYQIMNTQGFQIVQQTGYVMPVLLAAKYVRLTKWG